MATAVRIGLSPGVIDSDQGVYSTSPPVLCRGENYLRSASDHVLLPESYQMITAYSHLHLAPHSRLG